MNAATTPSAAPEHASKSLRIGVIGFNFNAIGGLEIVSKAIAGVLARRGHDVACLSLHETGAHSSDGVRIIGAVPSIPGFRTLIHRFPALNTSAKMRRLLSASDVVIAAHAHVLPLVMPIIDSLPKRPLVIGWLHGREVWGRLGADIAPQLAQADHLVAVSHFTADTVKALLPSAPRPRVIHNPVNTDIFVPASSPAAIRRHHVLTVGRHDLDSRHKGYAVLIEAMHLLRRKRPDLPLRLTITGSGPLLAEHERQIAALGVADIVSLAGRVSRDGLRGLYQTTDVFAFPSRHETIGDEQFGEGFGVVNTEAAACGRPVITSTHGGCPETVLDGVTGFTVDPTSSEAVAFRLATLFDMPAEDRDAMGARGRAMAIERFSTPVFERTAGEFVEHCSGAKVDRSPARGAKS